jgi:hypothetical protein
LRAFLLYVTEHAVASTTERIKEQRIGCEVLGRKPDYDPAADNIVRVRAHELRQRLDKYFNTEGAREPVVVSIPKGSYVPGLRAAPACSSIPCGSPRQESSSLVLASLGSERELDGAGFFPRPIEPENSARSAPAAAAHFHA